MLLQSSLARNVRDFGWGEETDAFVDDAEIYKLVFFRIADDADRLEPVLHPFDLFTQKFSQLDHTLVADAQVFLRAVGDAAG